MKKLLHNTLKLLLVFLIFTGLEGRVIVRYADIFHKNGASETSLQKGIHIRAGIIHCKLQCYTQQFRHIALPPVASLISFIVLFIIIFRKYTPFREHFFPADPVPLLQLRGPPLSN